MKSYLFSLVYRIFFAAIVVRGLFFGEAWASNLFSFVTAILPISYLLICTDKKLKQEIVEGAAKQPALWISATLMDGLALLWVVALGHWWYAAAWTFVVLSRLSILGCAGELAKSRCEEQADQDKPSQ